MSTQQRTTWAELQGGGSMVPQRKTEMDINLHIRCGRLVGTFVAGDWWARRPGTVSHRLCEHFEVKDAGEEGLNTCQPKGQR